MGFAATQPAESSYGRRASGWGWRASSGHIGWRLDEPFGDSHAPVFPADDAKADSRLRQRDAAAVYEISTQRPTMLNDLWTWPNKGPKQCSFFGWYVVGFKECRFWSDHRYLHGIIVLQNA
ncbi:uncharacterized protein [Miscanthus floridulus]|uniref:uncharacterized protein n=1 Tax=Miscanthus floridulus TaxID=154761 RepID=UPI0034585F8E